MPIYARHSKGGVFYSAKKTGKKKGERMSYKHKRKGEKKDKNARNGGDMGQKIRRITRREARKRIPSE